MKLLILNGPNLKYLGSREPHIYGTKTMEELEGELRELMRSQISDGELELISSDYEGALIERLYQRDFDGLIINPGALSHYSLALSDALSALSVPKVEVHISNVFAREQERQNMVTAKNVDVVIAGAGPRVYAMAMEYLVEIYLRKTGIHV
ncbi:MAG: type II 3-dehydroquinate dehydratase [Tissierellia bacterium]|nr:type II 3-dehydroquinate dehydratase [Tissierellia bacterium]